MELNKESRFKVSIVDCIFLILVYIASSSSVMLINSPLLRSIRTGEWILDNRKIMTVNIFSKELGEWQNCNWLYDLINAVLFRQFGVKGITILVSIIIAFILSMLLKRLLSAKKSLIIISIIFISSVFASLSQWTCTPFLYNALFFTMILFTIEKYMDGKIKTWIMLTIIFILQVFWTNINEDFWFGWITLMIFFVGYTVDRYICKEEMLSSKINFGLAISVLIGIIAGMINPYGISLFRNVFGEMITNISKRAGEWQSPDFHGFAAIMNKYVFVLMLLIFIDRIIFKNNKLKFRYMFHLIVWQIMFLYAQKFIFIYIIAVLFIIIEIIDIDNFSKKFKLFKIKINDEKRYKMNIIITFLTIFYIILISKNYEKNIKSEIESWNRYRGMEFIEKKGLTEKGFYPDVIGDMIIWKCYPKVNISMDTRTGVYKNDKIATYNKINSLADGFEKELIAKNYKWIWYYKRGYFIKIIEESSKNWEKVFDDGIVEILVLKEYYKNNKIIK